MSRIVARRNPRNAVLAGALAWLALAPSRTSAGEEAPQPARAGLEIALEAARAWAADAELVYVENDEPLAPGGSAARWGYLFRSRSADAARSYSVLAGRIVAAADLGFDFEAPPVSEAWIDSDRALAAADRAAEDFCRRHAGRLATMLLVRGAFNERRPDGTTWTVVYVSDTAPSLLVVIDATHGEVLRTLKG
ncbi:MAG: hypothetical protein IPK64_17340 [bacterium]|nr:hypothetical protein [bacterium]